MFQVRLKELREKARYSQYTFADAFGVAQSTVGNWEAGKREPNFETVQRLSDFFNVTTDYLLGKSDNPNPQAQGEVPLVEGLEFAFFQDYMELDDEDRSVLNDMAERMLKLKRLSEK